jgi:hypothetical protein
LPADAAGGVLAGSVSPKPSNNNPPTSIDRKAAHWPACVSSDT